MFNDPKQIALYKALANPGAISNPLSAGNTDLNNQFVLLQELMDEAMERAKKNCPHILDPCDCPDIAELEKLEEKLEKISGSVSESSGDLVSHAGSMTGNLTQSVARFDVAIKINDEASGGRSGSCNSVLEALGSIGGIGQDKVDDLVRDADDMTGDFESVVDDDGNLDSSKLARLMDKLDKLGISGDKLREFMEHEQNAQRILDGGLENFALSSLLGDWADDPCLAMVFDSVASDEIKDIVDS
ncbi:DUF7217 family protein [Endozoicomonas lisbonensis]|uniref:DUF7217 domain-containing protein n=1 Tax=Endozoicomonas lisbonensis TaxID=3120522 RepID=A0ABV2SPA0_9GAMM